VKKMRGDHLINKLKRDEVGQKLKLGRGISKWPNNQEFFEMFSILIKHSNLVGFIYQNSKTCDNIY